MSKTNVNLMLSKPKLVMESNMATFLLVRHLRIFASTYHALILKEQRSKIDARSWKFIFLQYSNITTKSYHLYDEVNKKFVLSIDLIFRWIFPY